MVVRSDRRFVRAAQMIFNQLEFVFGFFPILLALFYLLPKTSFRKALLIAFSFLFYAVSGLEHAIVLLLAIIWVYALSGSRSMIQNRWGLGLTIAGPALALTYYKYSSFLLFSFVDIQLIEASAGFSLFENVLLPAGISFFTFQLIAYAIDRYRGTLPEPVGFANLALYISFFPQLVAGPIVRFQQVQSAIANLADFRPSKEDISQGIGYVVLGMAAKVLIADTLSRYHAPFVAAPGQLTAGSSIYVLFSYSFRIYFDFYGYSLIAIGLGRFFGFRLPVNFDRPYSTPNPKEFWRQWHITLSYWIRDYVYLSLGGNKRYLVNIFLIFALCGLWHGAAWRFVVWGIFHGVLVVGYSRTSRWWDRFPVLIQVGLTFTLVSAGWILFVFSFEDSVIFMKSLLGFGSGEIAADKLEIWIMLLISAVVCFGVRIEAVIGQLWQSTWSRSAYSVVLGGIAVVSLLFIGTSETFIYFRF
jgi:alginate O-acetyltransferase complex protein AlgI